MAPAIPAIPSTRPAHARAWGLLFGLIAAGWAVLSFVHLYRLGGAGLDDWCYFASAAAAPGPLKIKVPLMGSFLGADHVWGIHWPGAPLLYTCLFALVPWSPLVRVLLFMALTTALAVATYFFFQRFLRNRIVSAAGVCVLLSDRTQFDMMDIARPEVLTSLTLTLLLLCLGTLSRSPGRVWAVAGAGLGFFLCPLLHPVLIPLGGLLCAYAGWQAWKSRRVGQGLVLAACYAGGGAVLASWFYFQPDALRQLRVHATAAYQPFGWGHVFLRYLGSYQPLPTMSLLCLLAFAGCWICRPRRGRVDASETGSPGWTDSVGQESPSKQDRLLLILTFLGGTAAMQLFSNPFYQVLLLPETILLAILAVRTIWPPGRSLVSDQWVTFGLLAFAVLHGSFWATRTFRYFQAGQPNMRAEIRAVVQALPEAKTTLISEILWEECLSRPDRYRLYTPNFACSPDVRRAYEEEVFRKIVPGDLLLMNNHDLVQLATPLPASEWEMVRRFEHSLPSRSFWGYDMTLYRKR